MFIRIYHIIVKISIKCLIIVTFKQKVNNLFVDNLYTKSKKSQWSAGSFNHGLGLL